MTESFLSRSGAQFLQRVCTINPYLGVVCIVVGAFTFLIWDANQSSKAQLKFEQEMAVLREIEAMKQADHRRLMEIIEALKPRRDLTKPADPDEGY